MLSVGLKEENIQRLIVMLEDLPKTLKEFGADGKEIDVWNVLAEPKSSLHEARIRVSLGFKTQRAEDLFKEKAEREVIDIDIDTYTINYKGVNFVYTEHLKDRKEQILGGIR